jgi:hypothetical protein
MTFSNEGKRRPKCFALIVLFSPATAILEQWSLTRHAQYYLVLK